jgi:predicted DNA-binding transcriptional regulator YafY
MQVELTKGELKKIYLILKALEEGQIEYPSEEWELEHFDERLIERKGIGRILEKLRKSLPEEEAGEVDKKILLRRYSIYGSEVDEGVYARLEKAFDNRTRVEIEYFSMEKAEGIKRKIDIYYKSRRYIIAFCHLRGSMRKFRTSRIMSAEPTEEKYSIPDDFDKRKFL